jgi:Flp pilus assembly CpaE family ATPase
MVRSLRSAAVWSPKGGVGKSVLSVALALKLSETQQTVLIDGNADNPDIANLLQCPEYPNVTGWVNPSGPEQLEAMLVRYSNRLRVLPGPPKYVELESWKGSTMESVLGSCREAGDTVVVDLGSALRDATIAALDAADRVFIPVTLDLLAVAPLRRLHRELDLLRLPPAKFRVVVNRHTNTPEITVDDIREFSEFAVEGVIPSAKELAAAVNRGEVGAALAGASPVGSAIAQLAAAFTDAQKSPAEPARKPKILGGLLANWRGGGA